MLKREGKKNKLEFKFFHWQKLIIFTINLQLIITDKKRVVEKVFLPFL